MVRMYLGPTVPGLVGKNKIFRGDLPRKMQERIAEDRSFARLVVPLARALTARKELEDNNSVLAVSYAKVEKSLQG